MGNNLVTDFFKKTDKLLWLLTVSAVIYSFLLISSMQRSGDYNYLRPQIAAVVLGAAAALLIANADYRFLLKKWYIAALIGMTLAVLVFFFGINVSGTDDTAWLMLPGGFTIQPSEFIKICFIITFTKHLSFLNEKKLIQSPLGVATLTIHALIPMVMIHFQGDDGTVLIFGLIFLFMSYIAGVQLRYFAALGIMLLVGIPVIWSFVLNDEHRNRFLALFDLDGNATTNYGWQQFQGKISMAGGGLTGSGLYEGSRVEYGIVPEQENDFIFTVAGEELGFIGCMILMAILFGIIIRVIIDARKANENDGRFLCTGVFATIASQTIINLGMVLGFLPVIGITLPLFSAGGTSALSTLICIGLVQSVCNHNEDDMDTARINRKNRSRTRIRL
ncbi:MAG: FtsW/RodA/SpoVE family cell cycle protein [Ruminococcus sp.]|nr:FtsW/RodA/SpoVE family cell cycle protein [Ruminococcus sp.]